MRLDAGQGPGTLRLEGWLLPHGVQELNQLDSHPASSICEAAGIPLAPHDLCFHVKLGFRS